MNDVSVFAPVVAAACVWPAMALSARLLVPARLTWRQYAITSAVLAGGLLPTLMLMVFGSPAALWSLLIAGLLPYVAGLYLRERAVSPEGRLLGFRKSSELALLAFGIALAAGAGVWGLTLNA
jgi:hypothetical protein